MAVWKVAVAGAGTSGLMAAALLARQGHDVTVFEQFDAPQPLGAGLLLQPTGLACLALLGLDTAAIELGARIDRLYGETARGRPVLDLSYAHLTDRYFGLGIHRGSLFKLLYDAALKAGAQFRVNFVATDAPSAQDDDTLRMVQRDAGDLAGPFDLVVDASGYHSLIRMRRIPVRWRNDYPFGALWGICADTGPRAWRGSLQQRYRGARHMIGVLPVGTAPGSDGPQVAFFWSLPVKEFERWAQAGIDAWHDEVISIWPQAASLVRQFSHGDQLTLARYGDYAMRSWVRPGLVVIGDAAHPMSPQLGQGANLGLVDAAMLARSLDRAPSIAYALARYNTARRDHVRFYRHASRWLTPYFQSNSMMAGFARDIAMGPLHRAGWVRRQMAETLAGVKTGIRGTLDPGQWDQRYRLPRR